MEKTNFLDWMLFGIRLFIGTVFVVHGGQKILGLLGYTWFSSPTTCFSGLFCIAPLIELIGGGLILTGFIIELGALLLIPGIIFFLLLACINANPFVTQMNIKLLLNLMMLAIVIGICGPGKWAIWDPGRSLRKKFLRAEE